MLSTANLKRMSKAQSMYSVEGARFQEDCLAVVGSDKSFSAFIGQMVTRINNRQISVEAARRQFNDAWYQAHN